MTEIRACLLDVKRRRAARIRRASLAKVVEAREDRRSLYFPCSCHLRDLWRQGKVRARRAEEEAEAIAAREQQKAVVEAQQRQAIADALLKQQIHQAARDKEAGIRACLAEAKQRRTVYIRCAALAQLTEAREDRRSLSFPCSAYLRSLWRRGAVASRGCK